MKLHAFEEDYLETILVLQKKLGMVCCVDVARHMDVSKPSVCHAVKVLKQGGFLTMDDVIKRAHDLRNANPMSHASAGLIDKTTTSQELKKCIENLSKLIDDYRMLHQ